MLEQLKIMRLACGKRRAEDRFGLAIDDHLRFLRMTLLFAAIMRALFFSDVQSVVRWRQSAPLQ